MNHKSRLAPLSFTFRIIFCFCLTLKVGTTATQDEKARHFPNIPELPGETQGRFVVLSSNTTIEEEELMANDEIGEPLTEEDLKAFAYDANEESDEEEEDDLVRILDGEYFEGDIAGVSLTRIGDVTDDLSSDLPRNAIVHTFLKWPKAEIPYVVSK